MPIFDPRDAVAGGFKSISKIEGTVEKAGTEMGDYGEQYIVELSAPKILELDEGSEVEINDSFKIFYSTSSSAIGAWATIVIPKYLEVFKIALPEDRRLTEEDITEAILGKRVEFLRLTEVMGVRKKDGKEMVFQNLIPVKIVSAGSSVAGSKALPKTKTAALVARRAGIKAK